MKTIAILASGTGGHVYPAFTIAQEYIDEIKVKGKEEPINVYTIKF